MWKIKVMKTKCVCNLLWHIEKNIFWHKKYNLYIMLFSVNSLKEWTHHYGHVDRRCRVCKKNRCKPCLNIFPFVFFQPVIVNSTLIYMAIERQLFSEWDIWGWSFPLSLLLAFVALGSAYREIWIIICEKKYNFLPGCVIVFINFLTVLCILNEK